ncbi:hypothetical protein PoB_005311400 [Plakobranchus ocellatus]|uniref:Uncharacterized protein n=1 Tax=Plakobranchus ocellatus TaxID=259542 RepID=A0AAV4C7E7_9GAST|nr:hypothetical protein PoB_005311400 [Plakobranchus ocellatus]
MHRNTLRRSPSAISKLDEKLDDVNAKLIDKIDRPGKDTRDTILSSEMRVEEKIERFKDRLEDKIMDLYLEKPSSIPSIETFLKQNFLIANVFESVQSMQQNLTDFGSQDDQVKTTVTRSQSHLDSKLESKVTKFENHTEMTDSALKSQTALSNACLSKIPGPVDEYFDVLATGRKAWRLAFEGVAYNNMPT